MKHTTVTTTEELKAAIRARWTEKQFSDAVRDLAHLHGWHVAIFRCVAVHRRNGSVYYQTPVGADGAGWPDHYMLRGEQQLVAELKVGSNKTTPEQEKWLAWFGDARVPAYVWYPNMWTTIEEILGETP